MKKWKDLKVGDVFYYYNRQHCQMYKPQVVDITKTNKNLMYIKYVNNTGKLDACFLDQDDSCNISLSGETCCSTNKTQMLQFIRRHIDDMENKLENANHSFSMLLSDKENSLKIIIK